MHLQYLYQILYGIRNFLGGSTYFFLIKFSQETSANVLMTKTWRSFAVCLISPRLGDYYNSFLGLYSSRLSINQSINQWIYFSPETNMYSYSKMTFTLPRWPSHYRDDLHITEMTLHKMTFTLPRSEGSEWHCQSILCTGNVCCRIALCSLHWLPSPPSFKLFLWF